MLNKATLAAAGSGALLLFLLSLSHLTTTVTAAPAGGVPLPGATEDTGPTFTPNTNPRIRGTTPPPPPPPPRTRTNNNNTRQQSLDYADYVHQHGGGDGPYPACSLQASLNQDGLICTAGAGWLTLTQTIIPPQLGMGYDNQPPVDPNKNLPQDLAVLPMPLPQFVDQAIIDSEKPTYYWYFRIIGNFYGIMDEIDIGSPVNMDLSLPPEWQNQRQFTLAEGGVRQETRTAHTPFAVSYTKDDHMIVIIRGTLYGDEWADDFRYRYAPESATKKYFDDKGKVHAGFFGVFRALAGPILEQEAKARAPKRITFAGHSLGGAVGGLLALHAAQVYPDAVVDLVTFGAPNIGDDAFVKAFNGKVNNRHLTFTGKGTEGDSYYIGDWISQVPCGPITTCPLLNNLTATELSPAPTQEEQAAHASYTYTALGGVVPFTWSDMNNADVWKFRSDVGSWRYSPVASHVCSYMCFLAPSVGDPNDRCVFTLEISSVPFEHRCLIMM